VSRAFAFHVNLERITKLDTEKFMGRMALRARVEAGITHRMAGLAARPGDRGSVSDPRLIPRKPKPTSRACAVIDRT
jgi:hypothetical protein